MSGNAWFFCSMIFCGVSPKIFLSLWLTDFSLEEIEVALFLGVVLSVDQLLSTAARGRLRDPGGAGGGESRGFTTTKMATGRVVIQVKWQNVCIEQNSSVFSVMRSKEWFSGGEKFIGGRKQGEGEGGRARGGRGFALFGTRSTICVQYLGQVWQVESEKKGAHIST